MHQSELIIPNYHVVLLHFPLALLVTGALIELFSFMWRRHAFRAAGRWMILLGALTAVPTVTTGLFALHDVATQGLAPAQRSQPWKEVTRQSPLSDQQWDVLSDHAKFQIAATALVLFLVVFWIACSDTWRAKLHIPLLLVLLASVGVSVVGAWHGGEVVYRYGTAVDIQSNASVQRKVSTEPAASTEQAATTTSSVTSDAKGAASESSEQSQSSVQNNFAYVFPPLQLHLILAGVTIAIALAALGLSIRKITQGIPFTHVDNIAAALGDQTPDTLSTDPPDIGQPRVAVSRFWLLSMLGALLTAAVGYWMLGMHQHSWQIAELWNGTIAYNMRNGNYRQFMHVIAGGSIALLALILSMLARWGPRQKVLLGIFALLLLVIVGLQIWLGVLLLFDTHMGPMLKFN